MDVNQMKQGEVMVKYNDYNTNNVDEINIKSSQNKALVLTANKERGNMTFTIMDTLFADKDFSTDMQKEAIITLIKSLKNIYLQL